MPISLRISSTPECSTEHENSVDPNGHPTSLESTTESTRGRERGRDIVAAVQSALADQGFDHERGTSSITTQPKNIKSAEGHQPPGAPKDFNVYSNYISR